MQSLGTAPGFHHVAIRAVDFDETIRFYTEGLGFRVHFRFSVPGRIDRAAFLDAGDGRFIEVFGDGSIGSVGGPPALPERRADRRARCCISACAWPMRKRPMPRRWPPARSRASRRERDSLGDDPLVEVRIAFVTGPNGEVIEFLRSEQL